MSVNKPQNIDDLLQLFVSTDDLRPKFMRPWREGNYIFASETHICIRVKGSMTDTDYPCSNSHTNNMFLCRCPDGKLNREILDNAISYAPTVDEIKTVGEDIECEECDGTGQVRWEYKSWTDIFDCPVCQGTGYSETARKESTGRKIIHPEAGLRIGHFVFRVNFLNLVLQAMRFCDCNEAIVSLGNLKIPARFSLSDSIDIILMPVLQDEYYRTIELEKI